MRAPEAHGAALTICRLPDDLLLPIVQKAMMPPKPLALAPRSDLVLLAALSLACRRLRDALRRSNTPLFFVVDSPQTAHTLSMYAERVHGLPVTTTHRYNIALHFALWTGTVSPPCSCVFESMWTTFAQFAPTLTTLDLDSIAPTAAAVFDLADTVLPRCASLVSLRLARWQLPGEPRVRCAVRALTALHRLLGNVPPTTNLLVLHSVYADAASRSVLRAANTHALGAPTLRVAGRGSGVRYLVLRDKPNAHPLDAQAAFRDTLHLSGLLLHDLRFNSLAALGACLRRGSPQLRTLYVATSGVDHEADDVHGFCQELQHLPLYSLQLAGLTDDARATAPLVACLRSPLRHLRLEDTAVSPETASALEQRQAAMQPPPIVQLLSCVTHPAL